MPTQSPQSHSSESHAMPVETPLSQGRRTLLQSLLGLIGAGITGALTYTISRFAVAPAFAPQREANWIELGKLEALPENQLLRKSITIAQDAGWGRFQATRLLWVIRKGETLTIFSGVCPHLGCSVNTKEDSFICACHGSKWDKQGTKLAGPSPRALDTLEYKVENGLVQVKYQDFKQGVGTKEVLS